MTAVTGGTGFIGAHLIEKLLANGEPVRALVRRKHAIAGRVETVRGDLVTGEGLDDLVRGADTVIHLAGVTKALRRDDYYTGNVRATENLMRAIAGKQARLVHVSSLAAMGPGAPGRPIPEDAEPRPVSDYGRSKLEAERRVRNLRPDAVVVRPPVVYGPGDTDVFQLLKSISKGMVLEIAGGDRWFSAIYVKDLCDGLLAAAHTPRASGRAYFLAHSKALSWSGFGAEAAQVIGRVPRVVKAPVVVARMVGACADAWARITGKPGIISRDKIREAVCASWVCDTKRAEEELGFVARTGIEAGLAESVAWYREAGWLA